MSKEFWLYNGDDVTRTVFDAFDHILPDPPHIKPSFHVREVSPAMDLAVQGLVEALESIRNRVSCRNIEIPKDEGELLISFCREALASYHSAKESEK